MPVSERGEIRMMGSIPQLIINIIVGFALGFGISSIWKRVHQASYKKLQNWVVKQFFDEDVQSTTTPNKEKLK